MHNFIKIFKTFQEIWPVSLIFKILTPAIPRPIPNDIGQSLGLYLVNIDVYTKFHHNSPLSSAIFTFSEFGARQKLNQPQMSLDNLMGYILSISMRMQNFITIFHSVREIGSFSLLQNLELCKDSTDKNKCQSEISWARSCHYQCLRKDLSKYSTQFKR